jgi:hypothetical protein
MSVTLALNSSGVSWNEDYDPVSESSRVVREVWKKERNYLRDTAIAWEPVIAASLAEISRTAATANWDGLGAEAVSARTVSQTRQILAMLRGDLCRLDCGVGSYDQYQHRRSRQDQLCCALRRGRGSTCLAVGGYHEYDPS